MRRSQKQPVKLSDKPRRPAITTEARENQLIALAIDLAEEQLRNGTASSQVITHYLKLGSSKDRLEKEIMEKQKQLITAKTASIESASNMDALYREAIAAMKRYNGDYDDKDSEDVQ